MESKLRESIEKITREERGETRPPKKSSRIRKGVSSVIFLLSFAFLCWLGLPPASGSGFVLSLLLVIPIVLIILISGKIAGIIIK